jgi:two-component system, cell cycle response regulator DivK
VNGIRSPELILVVDDNPIERGMLAAYLQIKGFTVRETSNGASAIGLACALRPRLILIDLAMTDLDGLETTRRLRANPSTKNAIIVAVTARVVATDRNEAHRAGCDDFIPKPFDVTTLADYVERALRLGRPRGALRMS